MSALSRVLAVATLRTREGICGPLVAFLCVMAAGAVAAALLTPGEAGTDRQRAVDGFVLDTALLATVLAAAALGSASFAADRESGRGIPLHATWLRTHELVLGSVLGHAACLAILVFGGAMAFLATTGLLAGGDEDRATTRRPIRAAELLDESGRPVAGGLLLRERDLSATYVMDLEPDDPAFADDGEVKVMIRLQEFVDDLGGGIPPVYPVRIRVGDGPDRVVEHRVQNPLTIVLTPEDAAREGGGVRILVRRADPAYTLGVTTNGLVAQGIVRPFALNVAKAFAAWLLGLLVIASAAAALSTVVGAPVAAAGALLLALVGRSLGILEETAQHLGNSEHELAGTVAGAVYALIAVIPDFHAYDLGAQVTSRWDIDAATLLDRASSSAGAVGILLLVTLALQKLREAGVRRLAATILLPPVLLALAALAGARLETARVEAGIPSSAARVPLGGFEPVAVTVLWLRQEELQRECRLSEAVATIRLITELQPRVPEAWTLLAWLLAWQVSESSGDPEEQWRWAEEGIAVLRRGLEHNPGSSEIEWWLGLVYFRRIVPYPALREVAERRIGRPPEAVALEISRRLNLREPDHEPYLSLRVGSATLLGFLLASRGDRPGAIRALEEALPLWEEVARDPEAKKAAKQLGQVRILLEKLRGR